MCFGWSGQFLGALVSAAGQRSSVLYRGATTHALTHVYSSWFGYSHHSDKTCQIRSSALTFCPPPPPPPHPPTTPLLPRPPLPPRVVSSRAEMFTWCTTCHCACTTITTTIQFPSISFKASLCVCLLRKQST